jgi:integrase
VYVAVVAERAGWPGKISVMTIRKVERHGETRLVVDITWKKKDGTQGRYRHDAQVQTMAAARAEERRIFANIAQYGEANEPKAKTSTEETTPARPTSISFEDAVELFGKGKAITSLKPSTRKGYDEIIETRLLSRFGERPICSLGFEDASTLDAELVKEGLSASRRRNVLIVLRSVLGAAHDAGKLSELPKLPKLPTVGRQVLRTLTRHQVKQILAASSPVWRLAFALAAYAGLRAGEVRALRWEDVDLVAKVLVVRLSHSKGETSTPKSGHEREIPLAAPLLVLLEGGGKGLVALTGDGEQWGEFGLLQAFQRAQEKAGVSGFRFHDLRHYFVTQLFRGGAPAPAVQALAGHADLSTTQRYAHVDRADLRAAIGGLPK